MGKCINLDEVVVRAITDPAHYDPVNNELSSSLFKGDNTSVSKTSITPLNELIDIFKRDLEGGSQTLRATCSLTVRQIEESGHDDKHPKVIYVECDPLENNPAHAEIKGATITRGIARKLIKVMDGPNNIP